MTVTDPPDQDETQPRSGAPGLLEPAILWGTLIGVVLVAVVATIVRLPGLVDTYPGGLADAEATHALRARDVVDFGLQAMLDGAGDLSIPLVSGIAVLGALTGFDVVTPRTVAALAGGTSILFTGLWLRRELGLFWGIAGAGVLAGSFWHILFSRIALAPITGAMALAATLWFLSMALRARGRAALTWYLLLGIAVGAGFLAAPGLRLLPLVVAGTLGVEAYRERNRTVQPRTRNWLIATIATLLTVMPYLGGRIDGLAGWTPWTATPGLPGEDHASLLTLPGAVIDTVVGLVLPADAGRGLNLPDDPWFSLFMLPWALIGALGLISASNNPAMQRRYLAGGAGVVALLVGISAVDAGHPGQYLLISPLLAGVVVYGFRTALDWARMPTVRLALALLIISGIGAEAYASWDQYRGDWASDEDTRAAVNAGLVDGLNEVRALPPGEPVFVNATSKQPILDYLEAGERVHTFDGSRALPFPAEENGYLLNPQVGSIPPGLEILLASTYELTDERDEFSYGLYRLDGRIRLLMPFAVPTVRWEAGPVLYGSQLAGIDGGTLTVLIAWNLPGGSDAWRMDVRATAVDSPGEGQTTIRLPANPLDSRLYQVLVTELDIPEDAGEFDLSVRLRDLDGRTMSTDGVDRDGFLLLNRYEVPEGEDR